MENNCGYHLFESDSEEEEEEVTEKKEVEEPPKKKTAFQVGGQQQNKIHGFKFLIESRFHCKAGRKWHESCTRLSAGVQCLGHQLQDSSEGPEEGEEDNQERGEEKNKEGDAETAG